MKSDGLRWAAIVLMIGLVGVCRPAASLGADADASRIPDRYIPLQTEAVPDRPDGVLEIGDPMLGSGTLFEGFELPTGAVWQPSLLVFGTYRTAFQSNDSGTETASEWVNRLDLFANLRLSGTERLLVGVRPLDRDGRFSGYRTEPDDGSEGWVNEINGEIQTLFFEGEIGEIFPRLDPDDRKSLDIGFSVGRQPLMIQEGMLINDTFDSVGIVSNAPYFPGATYWRATALYGWNELNRDDNQPDDSAKLLGLFNELDFYHGTVNLDLVYVDAAEETGSGFFAGLSNIQRWGRLNTAVRVNTSLPDNDDTGAVSRGTLLFAELSLTPHETHDLVYANAFWGIDRFASAARAPAAGGPLGRTGILFAAVGMGRYRPALGNRADNAIGGALGYQRFFDGGLLQLVLEAGGRSDTDNSNQGAVAVGTRYQQAIGRHLILQLDGFAADYQEMDGAYGIRCELRLKF